ncbi:NAD(+) synthase [Natronomonas halophila]|uniref:NAD(+) synthase n=1 Tax=Natronomonas halophila TaxID=2747817 RepID=UPI0015B58121|nr:NAD(+) synthase [Natronomonas halophila]QLD85636.1 NAD(+) synthase [Natronomonas halophila]
MATRDRANDSRPVIDGFRDDIETVEEECVSFIRSAVDDAGVQEVVVALSGGIDSTTAATLAVEALGRRSVNGLVLPSETSDESNIDDAQRAAFDLGIDFRTVDIQPVVDTLAETMSSDHWFERAVADGGPASVHSEDTTNPNGEYRRAVGNATARARMMATYFEANLHDRLVLGTGNRTELALGYFTKYGDGGVDILPLGDLYKTEVRRLAEHLDVPERIIDKQPTAGLWDGQTDTDELGASYGTIDAILRKLFDEGCSVAQTAAELGVEEDLVVRFAEMYRDAAHKRATPPTPDTYVS